jgi:hypothetical protein
MAPQGSHMRPDHCCHRPISASADTPRSVVRVKGSAGPVKGELEVTSSEPAGSPMSAAIAVLVLVGASTLATVTIGMVGWLVGFPAFATGLAACGVLISIFVVGLYVTYWRPRPGLDIRKPH